MEIKHVFFAVFLLLHLFFGIRFQRRILASILIDRRQKIINSILIWILPFFWYNILRLFINEENPTVTKLEREAMRKQKNLMDFTRAGMEFFDT